MATCLWFDPCLFVTLVLGDPIPLCMLWNDLIRIPKINAKSINDSGWYLSYINDIA